VRSPNIKFKEPSTQAFFPACSWGTSWGCDGTFLLTYGAAYGMPVDYTYAVQYGPTTMSAKQAKAQRWLQLGKRSNQATINGTECVMYKVKKGIRLVKLHEMLATFASTTAAIVNPAQILLDLVTYNSGFVRNLAVASSQFRVCGNARNLLVAALDGNISTTNPQVAALLRIKESIDTTGKLSDWSIAAGANPNYCSWTGLSCDTSRQVIGITLWSKYVTGLKGQLPPATAFQDLGGLTKLTLSEQPGISGTLPIDWSQLQLQDVRIGENSMTGTIPVTWGNMTNLQVLQLSGNKLTGPIPASFGALASLQVLKLFKNKLYGRIPDSLGGLTAMQDLQLAENSLTGSIPSALSNLWSLKVLYLWGNLLTGSIPSSFGALESLEDIQLSKNVLTGTIPSSLGSLTKITSLVLGNNQLTGRIPATLGSLTSLQHLVLTDNKLTGSLPGALTALKGLKSLLIETNMLTGSIPAWLGQLTNLQYVALANNKLTGTLPNAFSNLAELKTLDLGINKLVGTLPDGYQSLAQLTILSLATNNLKGAIPAFWSNMRDLRKLYLYDNPGMTGCLPHTWQALLEGNNWDVDKYVLYRTQLTGFCPA
jgi:Leucine-rich repeat (LRR) protein